ncbi:MAG: 5'-methylthioadenosine/S-adenosylhomocysteine nucleosidase [Bacilli bacterium]|jgi:adenosylhomocysteine nucleosidase|nr:5'-methylthioadenosine/S-adenosylhomocysteine nucleosidase [Bacilli bacterium]
MKTALVVCAMKEELSELIGKLPEAKKTKIGLIEGFSFQVGSQDFFAFEGMIGKSNVGFDVGYLAGQIEIERIFSLGVAGSLKDDIVPLNVVVADKVCYYDVDVTSGGSKYVLGQMPGCELYFKADEKLVNSVKDLNTTLTIHVGTIITGDSFATKKNMTSDLLSHFDNPLAVDMESASLAQAAQRLQVPFISIRGISDQVFTQADNGEVFDEFLSLSARRAASVFLHMVKNEFVSDEEEIGEDK